VDGLVGLRGNFAFTHNWYVTGWSLVGAGGADIDWDVAAGLGYTTNDTFDVIQQGPIAGLMIRF
jgi:hypothetical protein